MPGKLRTLGGEDVVRILAGFGFDLVAQRGSHVKLRRLTPDGRRQTLHIPLHKELRKGTLLAISQQAATYIPKEVLRPHVFTD